MKYALCIESIFRGIPSEEQISRTIKAGYAAVEVWGVDAGKRKVLLEARAKGVQTAMLVGARNFVTRDPSRIREELDLLSGNIDLARELECPNICLFAGSRNPSLTFDESRGAVVDFLAQAAERLAGSGATGIIESLSPGAHPEAFLLKMRDVIDIVTQIGRPEIKLQFDLFHTVMTDAGLADLIRANAGLIAYYQAADAPGRGQPGTGTLNFKNILQEIKATGFAGYFSWEFAPQGDIELAIEQAKKTEICNGA